MDRWYVRSRGRVMGPFRTEELRALRAARQLQGYDEVSRDQVSWTAADLCEVFAPPTAPPPSDSAASPASPHTALPPAVKRRPFPGWLTPIRVIVGGVVLSIVLLALIGVLILRGQQWQGASGSDAGPIRFDDQTSAADRDRALAECVGLVVAGTTFTQPGGAQFDRGVIAIKSDGSLEDTGLVSGTGFVVTPDGYLITNRHVVQVVEDQKRAPARQTAEVKHNVKIEPRLWVFFGSKKNKFEAEIVRISEDFDLAILRIGRPSPRYFALCDRQEDEIPRLPLVSAVGYPAVDRMPTGTTGQIDKVLREKAAGPIQLAFPDSAFEHSVRDGRVTKTVTRAQIDPSPEPVYVLQHSAQLFPGNSGGPLLTPSGLVVGINTWKRTEAVKDAKGKVIEEKDSNINYALTLPQLRREIEQWAPRTIWQPLRD